VVDVLKAPSPNELLGQSNVRAKINCIVPTVEKGSVGIFFASVASSSPLALNLRDCDANGPFTRSCEIKELATGVPCSDGDKPDFQCSCDAYVRGETWTSGAFGCNSCSCDRDMNGDETIAYSDCYSTCQVRYTCIMVPSVVGAGFLTIVFVMMAVMLRRRQQAQLQESFELSDIQTNNNNNYAYQPVMTSPPTNTMGGSSIMMTTAGGQSVMVNTQPMVMMTQTGEPVVVQVAYV